MNRELMAAALGKGVERAARLLLSDARKMLSPDSALAGDLFVDANGRVTESPVKPISEFARWRIEAIQELTDEKGPCVELYIFSHDGKSELGVTMRVRD